jgi:glycosyltransferase involved in cell wall biosynthesis
MRVAAIIPAFNEARTIANVVAVATAHPDISEVIVADDGSSDKTAAVAERAGARMIRHGQNRGKAEAMESGVRAATDATHFLFLDADLMGFRAEHIDTLLRPFRNGEAKLPAPASPGSLASDVHEIVGMVIGMRDRGRILTWLNVHCLPWISGERVVRRDLWNAVPKNLKKGFQIELALNATARRLGYQTIPVILNGLLIVKKEQKMGFVRGFAKRLAMTAELIAVSIRLMVQ